MTWKKRKCTWKNTPSLFCIHNMHLEKLSEHTLNVPSPNQGAELERNGTGCCDENIIIFGGPPRLLLYKKESNHCFQFLNRRVVAGALQQNLLAVVDHFFLVQQHLCSSVSSPQMINCSSSCNFNKFCSLNLVTWICWSPPLYFWFSF